MFTGLVEATGKVQSVRHDENGRTIAVERPAPFEDVAIGDSISINGCCLTVVRNEKTAFEFQAGPETLKKTNLGSLQCNDVVNLERAMRADGRFGGHIVQGHVDGVGAIQSRRREGEWDIVWFQVGILAAEMIPKGSVTVNGVSLTVCDVTEDSFSVMLIPHTLSATNLGSMRVGDRVNIETDVLGKYVRKYLTQVAGGLTMEKLMSAGFVE